VGDGQTLGKLDNALRKAVLDVMVPWVAVMAIAVLLVPSTVAIPALVMLTKEGFADTHVTDEVMSFVLPSLYLPTAEYCCVAFKPSETLAGEIVIELNARGRVIVAVLEVTDPRVAVIETGLLLGASTVAIPALVMLTAVGLLETQLTVAVMSFVVPSLYVPVAVYC
jgi:hypothetical protein